MGASYVFSMIISIAEPVLLIAVMVAAFLFLLQAARYFKNRNVQLTRENVVAEQVSAAAPCCAQPDTAPVSEDPGSAE